MTGTYMEDAIRESRFLQAMTDVANKVLEAEGEPIYDLVMERPSSSFASS
jgi:hypothetical protein